MKEVKGQNENICVVSEGSKKSKHKTGNDVKLLQRPPLSCKTNKLKSGQPAPNAQSLLTVGRQNDEKTSGKKLGFAVFEDESAACESAPDAAPSAASASIQTERPGQYDAEVARADICAEVPSEQYWQRLADSRQEALQETLDENQQLHERLAQLEEENRLLREALQQAEEVVACVQEWSQEQETGPH
ncbi:uncharacterized protein LOC119113128 [Pollicipes pollicipes]|uniref:uncharacterized protein LOC119113128 n=1 Tax=Pollicipes pollicipes TaxID=41117 RepID=UPI0018859401|nr:uncharacterized protein LOC119113128 [Pollicipes pollicipes]XP_037093362.1 uncharacterized protein LOC119113128 [Pollicipes pollicipes]XP_037093363.1 uncharacterized protein LOC119113128 [Pollicipes pollicipes]XP_037093364.1 uncharacterized protein LOC119113128 [Pollicipes pollicipes]XP_037093365.1 uncharacterized protein LOC119113128 [Pollicipes pollicipes]XP_037093366.1 uncharacterized protein LOC119113128 [Pollicipes pollicipes]XP_037093367.1 uncharacterized protein LOC119113128 [Pollic